MKRKRHAELRLTFSDQAPRIGSGNRGIDIVSRGPKWVRLAEHATGRTARLSRESFERLLAARANRAVAAALSGGRADG